MLQKRLIENLKEKQQPHEELAHTAKDKIEKHKTEILTELIGTKVDEDRDQLKKSTAELTFLKKRRNDRIKEEENATRAYGDNIKHIFFAKATSKKVWY